jgi:hypothetical protein
MDIGTREGKSAEFAVVVDAGMQLEAVVFTLPVVAGVGDASGHSVPLSSYQFAHRQHGGVHEAKLRFALKESVQQFVEHW